MNEAELDAAYSELCRMLTEQGEPLAVKVLARFALLAVHEIGDVQRVRALIASARMPT